ncbi:MAG: APC family permease [Acidobacteriota bacterium]
MSHSFVVSTLRREIGLWRGISLNMIEMVGIGPFITIPFILTAMGGSRSMLAWILGGLLAISDGLVTAELASQFPSSGGSYVFLRESYGALRWGRLFSFLFLFQIIISAPLSIASGAIGFSHYLEFIIPGVPFSPGPLAAALCLLTMALLMRRIDSIGRFSVLLWVGVMGTLGIVIAAGLPHLKLSSFTFWSAPRLDQGHGFDGLGIALIFAVYDYLGYYNIANIGGEVRDARRTVPRVIVISILAIAAIYITMNACLTSVLPMKAAMTSKAIVSDYLRILLGSRVARVVTVFILWTAFASIFSVMLGYSRILFAAGRDGNFFRIFGRLHPTEAYPMFAVAALGLIASVFCFLPLKTVLKSILSIRAVIPFMAQIVGAIMLRQRKPKSEIPFRMWLYPLPSVIALGLWAYIVVSPEKGFRIGGAVVIAAGILVFYVRRWAGKEQIASSELGEEPVENSE